MVTGEDIVVILLLVVVVAIVVLDGETAADEEEWLPTNFRLVLSPSSCFLHNLAQTKNLEQ